MSVIMHWDTYLDSRRADFPCPAGGVMGLTNDQVKYIIFWAEPCLWLGRIISSMTSLLQMKDYLLVVSKQGITNHHKEKTAKKDGQSACWHIGKKCSIGIGITSW
eukprot:scaffold133893_cov68-Attheya_sp.AAC.2